MSFIFEDSSFDFVTRHARSVTGLSSAVGACWRLLQLTTSSYVIVGLYRLATDQTLWRPIWASSGNALKKGVAAAVVLGCLSYPLTQYFLQHFAKPVQLARYSSSTEKLSFLPLSTMQFATLGMVLGQCSMVIEYFIGKELRQARKHVYQETIISRGKDQSFWGKYVEEWKIPPIERSKRAMGKFTYHKQLAGPFVRFVVLRFLLLPLAFIPFSKMFVMAALRSLSMAEILHEPFFKAKGMDAYQQALFVTERQFEFRSFGFISALLEQLPLIGMVFSISNRIGAAMWAHDLEKRQHAFASGQLQPTKEYQSKMDAIAVTDTDVIPGGFPHRKGPSVGLKGE